VVGGLNTNALEPVYHQAAKSLLERTAKSPREVFERLRTIYVDDAKFKQDFIQLSVETGGTGKDWSSIFLPGWNRT